MRRRAISSEGAALLCRLQGPTGRRGRDFIRRSRTDQPFFAQPVIALDRRLATQCRPPIRHFLPIDQRDRPMLARVRAAAAGIMLCDPSVEVGRPARVKGAVRAAHDVNVGHAASPASHPAAELTATFAAATCADRPGNRCCDLARPPRVTSWPSRADGQTRPARSSAAYKRRCSADPPSATALPTRPAPAPVPKRS